MKGIKIYQSISELLTLHEAHNKDGRLLQESDLGIIKNGAVVVDDDTILWVGETKDIPWDQYPTAVCFDYSGHVVTPELVDSHTHLVFAGSRSNEYVQRMQGVSYQKIAEQGGGILSTVKATEKASDQELWDLAQERIERMYSLGVGTIEIKSGYGLSFAQETRLSRLIGRLKHHYAPWIQIHNTFLAAHAIPTNQTAPSYMNTVVLPLLNELHEESLIDSVDVFMEQGYFGEKESRQLFEAASKKRLSKKIHADEFSAMGALDLAIEYKALSADHLLESTAEGIKKLASSQTVATLLPGTSLFLAKKLASARTFLDQGAKVAIASDYNPGSCHWDQFLLLASMSIPLYKLNLCEFWCAITLNAAHALGLRQQGAIKKGLKARLSFFKTSSLNDLPYSWGKNFATHPY
jgi:imidazolonepropionase